MIFQIKLKITPSIFESHQPFKHIDTGTNFVRKNVAFVCLLEVLVIVITFIIDIRKLEKDHNYELIRISFFYLSYQQGRSYRKSMGKY
jgi:hypothetical protein